MKISFITLFPEFIKSYIQTGLLGRAQLNNIFEFEVYNIRDNAEGNYKSVDDTVYGGGDGALIQYAPLKKTLDQIELASDSAVIYLSPQGRPLDSALINELKNKKHLVLVSGRYAGIDQRFITRHVHIEVSIGDYVLSGGELPSLVLVECLSRQCDGVLGNQKSSKEDSFVNNFLEAPQFTKPVEIDGMTVPQVLTSGDHKKIEVWKKNMSVLMTLSKREDLIASHDHINWPDVLSFYNSLSEEDKNLMQIHHLLEKIKKYSL